MHRLTIMTAFALACTLASCDHAPWSTPTPTHEGDALAPTLYLEKPQAGTAIDVLNNHHDWTECINVKVTRRDVKSKDQLFRIPLPLPDAILSTLQCNAVPPGKLNDVHCGNVFNILTTYCRVRSKDWGHFETGNQTFLHRHYITALQNTVRVGYMMRNHQDDFNVTVTKLEEPCESTEAAWEKHTPDMYDRCLQSLWGTWTGCTNNQGRGGSLIAGCYNYTLSVLDPPTHLDPTPDDPNSAYVWPGPGKMPGDPYQGL